MNKYKRRTINQNALLHDKEFVTFEDLQRVMLKFASVALEAGADEDKILEFLKGGSDEE